MSGDYIKLIIVCLGLGAGLIWQALRRQKRVRLIQDTPKSKISSAPQGLVEIQGFAWPLEKGHLNRAGQELVYYKFSLQRHETRGSGKNKKTVWVEVFSFAHNKPFYLLDPTGLAIVDPLNSEMEIETGVAKLWNSLTVPEQNYYLENIIPMTVPNFPPKKGLLGAFSGKYRVLESEVRAGCPLYVTGDFRTLNAESKKVQSFGLTHFASRIIDFNSRSFKNLSALLDKDSSGKVCHKEARDGYSFAAQLSQKKTTAEKLTENEFEVFGELRSNSNHKLYVADAHEDHLVNKLKSGQIFRVFGGAAMIATGVVLTLRLFVSDAAIEEAMKIETIVKHEEQLEEKQEMIQKEKAKLIARYHQSCVQGEAAACIELLGRRDDLQLDSKYIEYYSLSACKGGNQDFCKTKSNRVPSSVTNVANPSNP